MIWPHSTPRPLWTRSSPDRARGPRNARCPRPGGGPSGAGGGPSGAGGRPSGSGGGPSGAGGGGIGLHGGLKRSRYRGANRPQWNFVPSMRSYGARVRSCPVPGHRQHKCVSQIEIHLSGCFRALPAISWSKDRSFRYAAGDVPSRRYPRRYGDGCAAPEHVRNWCRCRHKSWPYAWAAAGQRLGRPGHGPPRVPQGARLTVARVPVTFLADAPLAGGRPVHRGAR